MHTDSGMTGISLSGYMPYMTVASLEMSDEPIFIIHIIDNQIIANHSIISKCMVF